MTPDQAYFQLSYLYLGQGKNGPAIEAARRSYEADPESKAYSRNLINILRQAASTEEELRLYAQIAKTADSPVLEIGYSPPSFALAGTLRQLNGSITTSHSIRRMEVP